MMFGGSSLVLTSWHYCGIHTSTVRGITKTIDYYFLVLYRLYWYCTVSN